MGDQNTSGNDPTGNLRIIQQTDLIKAQNVLIKSQTALIQAQTDKIDTTVTDGLGGTEDSLAYRVHEIEKHLHNDEKWLGLAATPDAELHRADRITLLPAAFQADAGNDIFGSWLQVLGPDDTPVTPGNVKFDFHKVLIVAHERNTQTYFGQIVCGESADLAAKIVAEDFTEFALQTGGGTSETGPIEFKKRRVDVGDKCWVRIWAPGANTGTLDFYIGCHEYEG